MGALVHARPLRFRAALAVGLAVPVLLAAPTAAQEDLGPLLMVRPGASSIQDIEASSLEIYRIPLALTLRDAEQYPWGLRLTFPVSFGAHELSAATDLGDLVERLQTITVVPGLEVQLPVGDHWLVKPFAELGLATTTATDDAVALWGGGVRTRGTYDPGELTATLGGSLEARGGGSAQALARHYSLAAVAADLQVPLGFAVGARPARGGVFGVVRYYPGLTSTAPVDLDWQVEAGLSFSTEPALALGPVKLPWIALGYRSGSVLGGVRLYLVFPF